MIIFNQKYSNQRIVDEFLFRIFFIQIYSIIKCIIHYQNNYSEIN